MLADAHAHPHMNEVSAGDDDELVIRKCEESVSLHHIEQVRMRKAQLASLTLDEFLRV